MNYKAISFILDDIHCHIHFFGNPSKNYATPLIIMPFAGEPGDLTDGQHMRLDPVIMSGGALPHILVIFETKSWNDDLSPWTAPAIGRGQPDFGGYARQTLDWILNSLIPAAESYAPCICGGKRGLLGYSMGGLFALWAMCQTDRFAAYGSCSGSLWYEGFTEYLERHEPASPCSVYLSLGDREEFTRHHMFSRVGSATRRTETLLRASPMVREVELVWNPGKHTGAVGERLAAAQLWLKKHL